MKKKVLIVSPAPCHIGGVSSFTGLLLNSSLAEKYDISCFDVLGEEFRAEQPIIKVIKKLWMFVKYTGRLVKDSVDLVQIHSSIDTSFWFSSVFLLLSKVFRKRV